MVQFSQEHKFEESIDAMVSDNEKKERIKRALDIHMLNSREKHMQPMGQTLFSFTQGDPNAMIGKQHSIGQAGESEEEQKQKSIEEQRMEQQQQLWQSSGQKQHGAPVRTCPCCVQFLQDTFHMSNKEATEFTGGGGSEAVMYGSNTTSESYGANAPSGEYSSNTPSGSYSSSSSNYSGKGPKDDEDDSKYMGQRMGYES
ncbi:hypothetical protein HZA99_01635 [Candidatus Woesearchaeota archaeon]|nr:hypothetical protein [Candidatus Woesearchaeota archaeon]